MPAIPLMPVGVMPMGFMPIPVFIIGMPIIDIRGSKPPMPIEPPVIIGFICPGC